MYPSLRAWQQLAGRPTVVCHSERVLKQAGWAVVPHLVRASVSRTGVLSQCRALETAEPDALFSDPLACHFAGSGALAYVGAQAQRSVQSKTAAPLVRRY